MMVVKIPCKLLRVFEVKTFLNNQLAARALMILELLITDSLTNLLELALADIKLLVDVIDKSFSIWHHFFISQVF